MATIGLQSAATGLTALNTRLDVIANNLANVNTHGFKASRANFQDLFYIERSQPGVENALGDQRPTGLYVGLGVKVSGTQLDFEQGSPLTTNRDLDVLIDGLGFFRVQADEGEIGYTRAGNFALNADGELVLANDQGRRLDPPVVIPPDAIKIDIDSHGRVFAQQPGDIEPVEVAQIETATFTNPAGLRQVGENMYKETVASGPAVVGPPAEENRGRLVQGILEGSNVDPTRELIDLIRTQRAIEMNSQSIRTADETLQAVAQLRR